MRELTSDEIRYVSGGGTVDCGCPYPQPQGSGNPGNLKPVGNAGERPNGNPHFNAPGTTRVGSNGAFGNSNR
jgi:hypothetical protein